MPRNQSYARSLVTLSFKVKSQKEGHDFEREMTTMMDRTSREATLLSMFVFCCCVSFTLRKKTREEGEKKSRRRDSDMLGPGWCVTHERSVRYATAPVDADRQHTPDYRYPILFGGLTSTVDLLFLI